MSQNSLVVSLVLLPLQSARARIFRQPTPPSNLQYPARCLNWSLSYPQESSRSGPSALRKGILSDHAPSLQYDPRVVDAAFQRRVKLTAPKTFDVNHRPSGHPEPVTMIQSCIVFWERLQQAAVLVASTVPYPFGASYPDPISAERAMYVRLKVEEFQGGTPALLTALGMPTCRRLSRGPKDAWVRDS
ncbi:hypothetical protein PMIN02_005352 [Paraphaeosphaeria minitans]